jgi:CRISPR-associated endonuclease/helicase Cas3
MADIAALDGLIHDIGKMTVRFGIYINGESNIKRGEIDHSYAGAKFICEFADSLDSKYHNVSRFIARTVVSHHGLHDWVIDMDKNYLDERISKDDDYDEIKGAVHELSYENELAEMLEKAYTEYETVRKKLFCLAKENSKNPQKTFGFYLGLFERFMQSVLIDADRTDTAEFCGNCQTDKTLNEDELAKLWKEMDGRLETKLQSFEGRNDKISLQRESISERCADFASHKAGVCRLIVPTGGGKTLSSLRYAIKYCEKMNMEKIFYIAPYMSILEQNSDEIRMIAGDENFLEHHSNVLADIEDENELQEYELRSEMWDSPVIATTMVQFLNALFSSKMSSVRRMNRLKRSVIIIDEVQSIPLKCTYMFNLAMNFLTKICGSTVVLCSATQPVFDELDYPLLMDNNESMTGDYREDFEVFRRTEVKPCIDPYGYNYDEAARFCYDKFNEHGNLLVIVNTKLSAKEIYERLKESDLPHGTKLIHLSTNMCPMHRRDKLKELRTLLKNGQPVICVTTQLIEAGVDVSFKCVVRSLAGMDNIAQAAGRCNRHGESEKICPVYVIKIKDENISRLKIIKESQRVSSMLIDSGQIDDYLSADTMSFYYRRLFRDEKNELSYNVKDEGVDTTLVNLLSQPLSEKLLNNFKDRYSTQKFKTAGDNFQVIDNNTADIIVPYNDEAKNLISDLDNDISDEEVLEKLRKSQKYTVGVYMGMNIKLAENSAFRMLKCGAVTLKEKFYSSEYGITAEGSMMETLVW